MSAGRRDGGVLPDTSSPLPLVESRSVLPLSTALEYDPKDLCFFFFVAASLGPVDVKNSSNVSSSSSSSLGTSFF